MDARTRLVLNRVELLTEEEADLVWGQAHARYQTIKARGEKMDVVSCFEHALEALDLVNRNAAG